MKSTWTAILGGLPAVVVTRLAGISPWLVLVLIVAALVLGLVQAIFPQDSADRLDLLLALRRSNRRVRRRHRPERRSNSGTTSPRISDPEE
jgi:hypothetical protein